MNHNIEFTDTHCHLVSEKLFDNSEAIVNHAVQCGVTRIINIAYNKETVDRGIALSEKFPNVWTTFGIQPHDASSYSFELAESMKNASEKQNKIVAVGEIGLDAYYTLSPMPKQIECFEHFLNIASQLQKPVVVHVRETHQLVHAALKKVQDSGGLKGVIHCFTGSRAEAKEFLDLGFYISFSGIVTFKSASELAEIANFVPVDRILIETDSPYLAPIPMRGKTNEPAFLPHTAAFIAEKRSMQIHEFADETNKNAQQLFNLFPRP